jgi:hypothetical protein
LTSAQTKEIEAVQAVLSSLTGAKFDVSNAPEDFRGQSLRSKWFLKCNDMSEARNIPYVNEVWRQEDDAIWLESLPLGDTIDWIEVAYGEEAAAGSIDVNYSDFGSKEFQKRFGREFPLVYQRIQRYEEVADGVSKSRRVHLELRKSGSKGIVVFTFAAKVAKPDIKSLTRKIQASVDALKEAYAQAMQV